MHHRSTGSAAWLTDSLFGHSQHQCNSFAQDSWIESKSLVCLQECRCPEDGGACTLEPGCKHKVSLRRPSYHGVTFLGLLLGLIFGIGGLAGYIYARGVPDWIPVRAYWSGEMYQELPETDGI